MYRYIITFSVYTILLHIRKWFYNIKTFSCNQDDENLAQIRLISNIDPFHSSFNGNKISMRLYF